MDNELPKIKIDKRTGIEYHFDLIMIITGSFTDKDGNKITNS
jgi:hypothetical protein